MVMLTSLGADPEVFLKYRKGEPTSAEGRIGGTKQSPLQMVNLPVGFLVQEDNVAAEYNIPPTDDPLVFAKSITRGLNYIRKVARTQKLEVLVAAEATFPIPELMTPHAQRLGCDPDFNAWIEGQNPPPKAPFEWRSAAGHVHLGLSYDTRIRMPREAVNFALVRMLDLFLGVPSILVTPQTRRRELYGQAGAMRHKAYGLEYRVLDNFWITSPQYCRHIFSVCDHVVRDWSNYWEGWEETLQLQQPAIQEAINTHNVALAESLVQQFNLPVFTVR